VNGGGYSPPQKLTKVTRGGYRDAIGGWTETGEWRKCLLAAYRFAPGERFLFESTGGGGWGNPLEREVVSVLDDVLDEYVSLDTARDVYGVIIDPKTLKVDVAATQALRAKLLHTNGNGTIHRENGIASAVPHDASQAEANSQPVGR
jgi:N-methylhydantoinase B/oxoprolinase/acetone carboxylase alpha subunit